PAEGLECGDPESEEGDGRAEPEDSGIPGAAEHDAAAGAAVGGSVEEQSELATSLEKRQQGEQFRIIDPPSLPQKPAEPNRPKIVLMGWALGLGVGAGLAALREFTDSTLHSEKEVSRH